MQIRKNVQQDKIDRDRLRLAYEVATGSKLGPKRLTLAGSDDAKNKLLAMTIPNPTIDEKK